LHFSIQNKNSFAAILMLAEAVNQADSGVAQSHDTAFALLEEGDGEGCPRCRGILSYCLSKSAPALYLLLARSPATANIKYGQYADRLDIVLLQLASSWSDSAPQARASSYIRSESSALYAPLLLLE
jgi:hypothetical protein